jgi:phosphoserine phosphatase
MRISVTCRRLLPHLLLLGLAGCGCPPASAPFGAGPSAGSSPLAASRAGARSISEAPAIRPIQGFTTEANAELARFLVRATREPGRKVAVFDGDGTVLGQAPHYLADECLYAYARQHPERKPELVAEMVEQSNVSMAYVQNRVRYLAGMSVREVGEMGERCFRELYPDKIFEPMRELIALLGAQGFEVWIVSASPEALYQGFLSRAFGLPPTRVIGVKSVVRGGVLTEEMVLPIPQDAGKKEAIETFVQAEPLVVAGNSRGDKEMIESSRGLRIIVNPDEHVAPDQGESVADYARRNGWLVVRIRDVPAPTFPAISSRQYGVSTNKSRDVP